MRRKREKCSTCSRCRCSRKGQCRSYAHFAGHPRRPSQPSSGKTQNRAPRAFSQTPCRCEGEGGRGKEEGDQGRRRGHLWCDGGGVDGGGVEGVAPCPDGGVEVGAVGVEASRWGRSAASWGGGGGGRREGTGERGGGAGRCVCRERERGGRKKKRAPFRKYG